MKNQEGIGRDGNVIKIGDIVKINPYGLKYDNGVPMWGYGKVESFYKNEYGIYCLTTDNWYKPNGIAHLSGDIAFHVSVCHKVCGKSGYVDFRSMPWMLRWKVEKRGDFEESLDVHTRKSETLICPLCDNDKIIVGSAEYETTGKCPDCGFIQTIHSG